MKRNPVDSLIESLVATRSTLLAQLSIADSTLTSLTQQSGESPEQYTENQATTSKDYDTKWSYPDKFIYLLKRENRFLHFREAAELIVEIEGGDPSRILAKLSSSTHVLKKRGVIIKFQASRKLRDTFWGSPKWIDGAGIIKEPYNFNKEYLYKNTQKYLLEV
ncbi:hypothetical protein [Dyadobacter sp. BHUBP1]|uniref:hypothetical protein n=1 Tax=Dyadobacter sp. BHUBP1 TaxID=3424178 RepID=UPI003D346272